MDPLQVDDVTLAPRGDTPSTQKASARIAWSFLILPPASSLPPTYPYVFTGVAADHTIFVAFQADTTTVSTPASSAWSLVLPAGPGLGAALVERQRKHTA